MPSIRQNKTCVISRLKQKRVTVLHMVTRFCLSLVFLRRFTRLSPRQLIQLFLAPAFTQLTSI